MTSNRTKKGFTLVELIIATGIFAIFLTSIVTLLVDIYRSTRRIILEDQIYQDQRIMIKQIADLLENNTIDYEEYRRDAVGGSLYTKSKPGDPIPYSYGDYGKLFYDFGLGGPGLLNEGAYCQGWETDITPPIDTPENTPGCIIDKTTIDKNTGKNPPIAILGNPGDANAFCGPNTLTSPCPLDLTDLNTQSQLYLINEKGDKKTILGIEPVTKTVDGTDYNEHVLSTVWLNGMDNDSDDIPDTWTVAGEFDTAAGDAGLGYLIADLITTKSESDVYKNFSPISPLRTNILSMKFYVSPLEDPYKAFAETDPAIGTLVQPHITIVMTVEPSASELTNYLGEIPRQTIETTIYSKVKQEVRSY
jgi:prepilin-type N-terminal cleavage/methylation domain-containing protein